MVGGTRFWLGEQKLYDFGWGAKIGELKNTQNNQIQSITLCMQYVFFEKMVNRVYNWLWGKASEAGEFLTIFVLK